MTQVLNCTDKYCKYNVDEKCTKELITIVGFEHNCIDFVIDKTLELPKEEK